MGTVVSYLPGRATGASVSHLTNLPPELLGQILEYLTPDQPEVGDTRPVSYDKLIPGEIWYDITRNRRALRSLCLASRGLCTIAQPILYRIINILDEEGMLLLFRTLTENPALGQSARYLSCHLTLTRLGVVRELKKAINRLANTFRPDLTMLGLKYPEVRRAVEALLVSLPSLSTQNGDFDDIPQMLLFYITTFLTRLDTLMLQTPICDDHAEYTALFERFMNPPSFGRPLHQIKTLLLQGDPELLMHFEGNNCDCEVPELWGVQARRYWPMFNGLPSLTTVEVCTDDGVWSNIRHRRPDGTRPPYLENITHLYLHNSVCSPRDLHHVLVNAPNLATLYMTPRRYPEPYFDPEAEGIDEHEESFDAALRLRPRQLRHLDVAWYDCVGQESLIGSGGRLASLPDLVCLEKLCIQLAVLYGTDPDELLTPISSLLPPNLVELTLEEWWWENLDAFDGLSDWNLPQKMAHYRSKSEYRDQALKILSDFGENCNTTMPKLKKVTFQTKFLWTWKMDGLATTHSHFEHVKALFKTRGVAFEVDEDQSGAITDSVD